jgi:hypothetical protein
MKIGYYVAIQKLLDYQGPLKLECEPAQLSMASKVELLTVCLC